MSKRFQNLRNTVNHIRAGSLIFMLLFLLIIAGIAAYVGVRVHDMRQDALHLRGEVNAQEATVEYNRYLLSRVAIVTMVGCKVEDLLEAGADSGKIEEYLTDWTNIIVETLDPESTGLYGLFNGTYVDGAGWVPSADFVPTERPWYVQTLKSGREITFVDPYVDAQTNTVMLTVSTLMSDRKSVLAMDVSLRPVQEMVENVVATTIGSKAFIMDGTGNVIAHSDRDQIGKNYLGEPESLGGTIARRRLLDGQAQFDVSTTEGNYAVYIHNLEGGWYSVSLIDDDVWHRPLHRSMIIFAVILGFVLLSVILIFLRMSAKNAALQELHDRVDREEKRGEELQALSETDRMTGLNDRVSGERKINGIIRSGRGGMFLELDIDHFKEINDTHGHQTGDIVILAITEAIRNTFRTNDVTMRLGGDEFGVFAVGIVNRDMGKAMIQRLFSRIEALYIPEMKGEKICVSVGAALCREGKESSFHELYAVADEAMYRSKKISGNSLTFGTE